MLNFTRGRWRTAATALTATALTAGTLAFAAAPAQAADAPAPGTLTWGISAQFSSTFSPKPYAPDSGITGTDGATVANGIITFTGGVSGKNGAGEAVHSYDGTVVGAFIAPVEGVPTEQYAISIADPIVTVGPDGAGDISAVVSARNIAGGQGPAEATTPARTTVVEFAGATTTDNVVTATPNWEGVLTDAARISDLDIPAGQPLLGKSFHPDFLEQLTSGTRSHFYASGSATADPRKNPAPLSAAIQVPTTTASASVNGDYVDIAVNGTGFNPSSRPGGQGVYIGFGVKRDIFKIAAEGEVDGAEAFIGSDWVMPASFTDGAWTKTLAVEKAKLVKGVQYAVYTWTAHGNPTAGDSQYSETVVSIPGLPKNAAKVKAKVQKKPTTKKKGKAKVTVAGLDAVKVTGKVKVTLKKGKAKKKANGKLNKKGIVKLKLPKLAKGKWKVTVKYTGDTNYKGATKKIKLKIKK